MVPLYKASYWLSTLSYFRLIIQIQTKRNPEILLIGFINLNPTYFFYDYRYVNRVKAQRVALLPSLISISLVIHIFVYEIMCLSFCLSHPFFHRSLYYPENTLWFPLAHLVHSTACASYPLHQLRAPVGRDLSKSIILSACRFLDWMIGLTT
jgi:hypothetical protein